MYRFLAFFWNTASHSASGLVTSWAERLRASHMAWECVLETPGFAVYHANATAGLCTQRVPGASGVVCGTVFRRNPEAAKLRWHQLDDRDGIAITASRGRHLVDHYWGRYVSLIRDANSLSVLRDPTGGLPCLFLYYQNVYVVFSDFADCASLDLRFTLNLGFVAALAAYFELSIGETGFNEVSEVLPGTCVCLRDGNTTRETWWTPRSFVEQPLEDKAVAITAVRHAVCGCVLACVSDHDSVVHRLSGGLDSSIVLSVLKESGLRRLTCVNYCGDGVQEDERYFARLAAKDANCELIIRRGDPTAVRLESLLDAVSSERPRYCLYSIQNGGWETEIVAERSATAIVDGLGGDAVFYRSQGSLSVADFAKAHWISPRLISVVHNAARVDQLSLWAVLARALTALVRRRRDTPVEVGGAYRLLLNREWFGSVIHDGRFVPDWYRSGSIPPGKTHQIWGCSMQIPFYDAMGLPLLGVHPLYQQPIIEVCLRVPTYVLIEGGWDRSIARQAFAQSVPQPIVHRRTKGASNTSNRRIFTANLPFLRELMLDGFLVREGVLDRKPTEECLARVPPSSTAFNEILLDYAHIETWLQRMRGVYR